MAKDLCSWSVRIGGNCGDDCSTSDGTERPQVAQRLGGISTQAVGLKDVEGGGVVATERCMALLLPTELSRRVFSQLDYRDLVQCSLVCKQWSLETTELRQGWKEELSIEACTIRGVHFNHKSRDVRPLYLDLAGSPDVRPFYLDLAGSPD